MMKTLFENAVVLTMDDDMRLISNGYVLTEGKNIAEVGEGTYGGEAITVQTKTVDPLTTSQTVIPDEGYDYLSQVVVNAIYYNEADNSAGGKTVTIGKAAEV